MGVIIVDEDFSVTLLDNPKVEATAFPRSGNEGLAKSIKAVPEGWVRPASTHISIARILTPGNDGLWRWFDIERKAQTLLIRQYEGNCNLPKNHGLFHLLQKFNNMTISAVNCFG